MECAEIIAELHALSSAEYKANVVKLGIPEQNSIGVSTGDVRNMAKKIKKSNALGFELWNTGFHEARLLAVLIFDKKTFPLENAEQLMNDVVSWDLCHHLCKYLVCKLKGYEKFIFEWSVSEKTYFKRGAFTLIASAVMYEKSISNDVLDSYLKLIKENSCDEREHVKKAVSWALRQMGKKDFTYQEKAILLAHEMKESDNKAQVWIAKDALRELEKLVQVEGRERLISSDSQMGKEV